MKHAKCGVYPLLMKLFPIIFRLTKSTESSPIAIVYKFMLVSNDLGSFWFAFRTISDYPTTPILANLVTPINAFGYPITKH